MEFEPKNFGFKRGFWNIKVPRKNWRATRGAGIQENRNSITNRNVSIAFLLKTRQSETQLPQGIFAHVFLEKRKTEKVVSRVEY